MMRPLTSAQIREAIATKFPPELRGLATELVWSAHDGGLTAGLAGQARGLNPFESILPPPITPPEYSMQSKKKR